MSFLKKLNSAYITVWAINVSFILCGESTKVFQIISLRNRGFFLCVSFNTIHSALSFNYIHKLIYFTYAT